MLLVFGYLRITTPLPPAPRLATPPPPPEPVLAVPPLEASPLPPPPVPKIPAPIAICSTISEFISKEIEYSSLFS